MMERSEQLRREPTRHAAPRWATEGAEEAELLPSAALRLGNGRARTEPQTRIIDRARASPSEATELGAGAHRSRE